MTLSKDPFCLKSKPYFFLFMFILFYLAGACSQQTAPIANHRSTKAKFQNGLVNAELKEKLKNAKHLDQDGLELAGGTDNFRDIVAVSYETNTLCTGIAISSFDEFACPCHVFSDYNDRFDFYLIDAEDQPFKLFPSSVIAQGLSSGRLGHNQLFNDSLVGFNSSSQLLCDKPAQDKLEYFVETNSEHHFFTHSLAQAGFALSSQENDEKFEYKVSAELGNPRFVEGFGAVEKSHGEHEFYFWYSNGTYTVDTDLDHTNRPTNSFTFDPGLGVKTTDIVAMAVLGKGLSGSMPNRVLTVFASGDSYFYTIGTAENLSAYTGDRKIAINVPEHTKIIGASAHPHGLITVRFYLSNYHYVSATKGYLGTAVEDPAEQGSFSLDFSSSRQTAFQLIEGKASTDVVSIGGLDRDHIFTMYYDELSEDLSGTHQFSDADFQVFVESAGSNADADFLGTVQLSTIDQNDLKTTFNGFDFSSGGSNPIADNTELALLNIWNGTKGNMSAMERCISDTAGTAADLIDIVLDLFSVAIDDERFWQGIEVGFPSNLGEDEKIAEAAKATIGKFFGPIKKINDGRVLLQQGEQRAEALALVAQGFVLLIQKGYTYIVAGVKAFFSSWESWLKFGAALLLAAAEAETTGGTYLMLKVAEVFLDLINLGLDIPSLIADCESIHASLDLEDKQ